MHHIKNCKNIIISLLLGPELPKRSKKAHYTSVYKLLFKCNCKCAHVFNTDGIMKYQKDENESKICPFGLNKEHIDQQEIKLENEIEKKLSISAD